MNQFERELSPLRQEIDTIDREIIMLLSDRFKCVRDVGQLKSIHDVPMMQRDRVESILASREALARSGSLPDNLGYELFELIIKYACEYQDEVIRTELREKNDTKLEEVSYQ